MEQIDLEIQSDLHHHPDRDYDQGYKKEENCSPFHHNASMHMGKQSFSENAKQIQQEQKASVDPSILRINKLESYTGVNSQKDCQIIQNGLQAKAASQSNPEKQQKEQSDNSGNINNNNNSLEQSTAINTLRSSQNMYIQNYDTAGICEQNFCYCFTHTVDIVTLLLAFIVGRTAHRKVFFWRILFSLCFDLIFPSVFVQYYNSFRWDFIAGQMGCSFLFLASSLLALAQDIPQLAKLSLSLNVPIVSLFKAIVRCSNNLFCREDQVNTMSYLSHRPIISLYLAHIAKSAILSSSLISYIVVVILTMHNIQSLHSQKLGIYMLLMTFYSLDLLRSAYQAIVAENNHRLKANVYNDITFKRQFSNDLAQDISIQNYDNQVNQYKPEINNLLAQQNKKIAIQGENAKTNKVSSLQVCQAQRLQEVFVGMKPQIYSNFSLDKKSSASQQETKKARSCNYKGFTQLKKENQKTTIVFYDQSKDVSNNMVDDQMLQSVEIGVKDQTTNKNEQLEDQQDTPNNKTNVFIQQFINQEQQEKEENVKHQMNLLLMQTLHPDNHKSHKEEKEGGKQFSESSQKLPNTINCLQECSNHHSPLQTPVQLYS